MQQMKEDYKKSNEALNNLNDNSSNSNDNSINLG
jgi:hypothetical protein